MFEQDYLMRLLLRFAEAIRLSLQLAKGEHDPKRAADMLEDAVGQATDLDGNVLLSLTPDSLVSVLQVSGVDPQVTEYIARSLRLTSQYLHEAGEHDLAELREYQAQAVADAYEVELPDAFDEVACLDGETLPED